MTCEDKLRWGMTAGELRNLGMPIRENVPADASLKEIGRFSASHVTELDGPWMSRFVFELNGQDYKSYIYDVDMPVIEGFPSPTKREGL